MPTSSRRSARACGRRGSIAVQLARSAIRGGGHADQVDPGRHSRRLRQPRQVLADSPDLAPMVTVPPVGSPGHWRSSERRLAGTGRSYDGQARWRTAGSCCAGMDHPPAVRGSGQDVQHDAHRRTAFVCHVYLGINVGRKPRGLTAATRARRASQYPASAGLCGKDERVEHDSQASSWDPRCRRGPAARSQARIVADR